MKTALYFNLMQVLEQFQHTLAAKSHSKHFGTDVGPSVWLVHDQGVYLMSNGLPRLGQDGEPIPEAGSEGVRARVAYAEGMNPETDTEWYQTAREAVGGDDFADPIPAKSETVRWLEKHKDVEGAVFKVTFAEDYLSFAIVRRPSGKDAP